MNSDGQRSDDTSERSEVSAKDIARVIRRFSQVFGSFQHGNLATEDALSHLAEHLEFLGEIPVRKLRVRPQTQRKESSAESGRRLKNLSLSEVEKLIDNERLTKSDLTHLARQRFGMPEAQLKRLPLIEVRDELRAALGHERSLEFIERNAEMSGRSRQS